MKPPRRVNGLRNQLMELLQEGDLLLALQALRQADRFQHQRHQLQLRLNRRSAQGLIGRYAAAKATGVAMNPLLALDLAGGAAWAQPGAQLCQLYGVQLTPAGTRRLLTRLSGQTALGGAQLDLGLTSSCCCCWCPSVAVPAWLRQHRWRWPRPPWRSMPADVQDAWWPGNCCRCEDNPARC